MNVLVKIWLNIGILGQNKIGLVFGFCVCHFIGIGLVSVCHFPENDISCNHHGIRNECPENNLVVLDEYMHNLPKHKNKTKYGLWVV